MKKQNPKYIQKSDSSVVMRFGRSYFEIEGLQELGMHGAVSFEVQEDGLYRFRDKNGRTSRAVRPTIIRDYSLD